VAGSRTSARDTAIARLQRESEGGGDRFVDMRLDFEDERGEVLLSVGGQWDRILSPADRQYAEETDLAVVVRAHEGQESAVRWFAGWLAAHAERRGAPAAFTLAELEDESIDIDPSHVYSALFAGGRRGGKTWIGVADGAAYAVAFPGAIVWIVSPSDQKHDEVRRYMAGVLAADWIERETLDGYELANGSQILLKSAYVADGLKEGKADLVILNEGQMMTERAYTVARGAIVDSSGLVLVCANPPVEKKDHQWVSNFASDAAAGRRASVFIEFNPLRNPHIDRRALLAMRSEVDERTFAIEVLGQFRGPADAVAYNWIRLENERRVLDSGGALIAELNGTPYVDVTASFMATIEEGIGIERILGLDVQRFPYIGGPVYQIFAPAGQHATRDNVVAWIVDEIVLEGGDEVDYCAVARAKGLSPSSSLIVCDASGRYQHSRRRTTDQPPPTWQGRGSFDIIRGEGYRRIVPPMRRMKVNPAIVDRARAFTSMIASGSGRRRLFADPDRAPKTCNAIRDWRTVNGSPSRSQNVAHLGDGASYPIVRLFPRVLRSGKPGSVDPVVQSVDNPANIAAAAPLRIVPPTRGPSRGRRGDRTRGL
jgi:hypothetical protein